jgi:hypothetical protein
MSQQAVSADIIPNSADGIFSHSGDLWNGEKYQCDL